MILLKTLFPQYPPTLFRFRSMMPLQHYDKCRQLNQDLHEKILRLSASTRNGTLLWIRRDEFLGVITHLCRRNTTNISLNRKYSPNDRMLRYPRVYSTTFMDTMFAAKRCVSVRGYTCTQLYATEFGFVFT